MNPKVSICTSVLNQRDLLNRMILSVISQTYQDWELIIVDDGSTEDIRGLVESTNDPRIIYERFPDNRGIPHGMNHALSLATGAYLQPLSADEFLWERKLEVQVGWMEDHPLIGCTWGLPTPNVGKPWPLGPAPEWEQYQQHAHNRSREAWIRTLLRLENVPIGGAGMLMRKECYDVIGGFDPQFFDVSDLEWFVRFFQHYQGWVLPYRFADAVHPDTRLTAPKPGLKERFQDNMQKLHAKHKLVLPPAKGRVTIGIPVRNMETFVERCLASVFAQTYQDFDLIVFDDASTDQTLAVVTAALQSHDNVQIIASKDNVGVAAANNHMLGICQTDFYMPFSADDVLDPTFLERCMQEFDDDRYLEMVASQTDFIDENDQKVTEHPLAKIAPAVQKPRELWLQHLWYGNQYFGAGVYRTQALLDVGGWDTEMGVVCDWEMYVKLLQRENIKIIEEPLTHTRVHPGQQSQLKTREEGLKLREQYHRGKVRYWPPRTKLIIATPFYEMKGFSPYIASLFYSVQMLTRMNIDCEFWELSGDSYIERAKNTLLNKFLEDPDATDILMVDGDMQWDPRAVATVLQMPEEIVQGSYPQKNAWEVYTARPFLVEDNGKFCPVGRQLPDGSALIKAEYLAGGFLRIKRSALEKFRDAYYDKYWYCDNGADPSAPDRRYIEFFTCERGQLGGEGPMLRWGEDRVFGRRMREIGIESWIYPNIDFGHYGIKGWMGNYDRFLRNPPKQEAA